MAKTIHENQGRRQKWLCEVVDSMQQEQAQASHKAITLLVQIGSEIREISVFFRRLMQSEYKAATICATRNFIC